MIALYSRYEQNTTNVPHKYKVLHTIYIPTLICRGADARTDGRTDNIYSILRDKLLLPGEHVFLFDKIFFFLKNRKTQDS